MKLMAREPPTKAMPTTPARHEAARLMYLPNRKGTLKRDNDYRQKVHRRALQTIRGDIDTSEPWGVHFSRGTDLKKARQKEDRLDYVEKCNRKLVEKMMMIMQGLCGTMMSELSLPEFNPGTLNQRIRQRELQRIDRDNLALMHRIESASSSYNKALIKPKHFQEPHMGLFPRSEHSVKSATTKSRRNGPDKRQKRAKTSPVGATCGRSGGVGVYIREAASITSALTEPSGMLALAKQPESSTVTFAPGEYWVEEEGGEASTAPNSRVENDASQRAEARPTDSPTGVALSPKPPTNSRRATCDSSLQRSLSSCRKGRRLAKPVDVKPGESVFVAGVNISGEYMVLDVRRATSGYGADGTAGFRINAYCPSTLTAYSVGVSVKNLRAFTSGSRTAVRQMFRPGLTSKNRWELLASHLELRSVKSSAVVKTQTEKEKLTYGSQQTDDLSSKERGISTLVNGSVAVDSSVEGRHPGIDVSEPNTPEAAAAGGLGTPSAAQTNDDTQDQTGLELVLRPPDDAVVISLQSVVRGVLTRYRYRALKIATVSIQAAIRGWRDRVGRQRREAATRIAAVARGKRGRARVREEVAARGIQKKARVWLHTNLKVKNKAASQLQAIVRGRHARKVLAKRIEEQQVQDEAATSAENPRQSRRSRLTPYKTPSSPRKTGPSNNAHKGGRPALRSDNRNISSSTNGKRATKSSGEGSCSQVAGGDSTTANVPRGSAGSVARVVDQGPRPPGAMNSVRSPYRRPRRDWGTGTSKPASPVANSPPSLTRRGRPNSSPESASIAFAGEDTHAAHRRESALVTLDSGDDSTSVVLTGTNMDSMFEAAAAPTITWDGEGVSPSLKSRATVFLADLKECNEEVLLERCIDSSYMGETHFTKEEIDRIKAFTVEGRTLKEELQELTAKGAEKSSEICSSRDLHALYVKYFGMSKADTNNKRHVEEAREEWASWRSRD